MTLSKNRLKELAAYRMQKRCDDEAVFVVEGPKIAGELLGSGFAVRTVCATADWLQREGAAAEAAGAECYEVSESELERLSGMKQPNQVWMLAMRQAVDCLEGPTLALDRIQDPGNMGTMLRTADWFGVRHVVCSVDTVSCYNPKVVQASMGAIFRTRVDYVDLSQWLGQCGRIIYGASLQGDPIDTVLRKADCGASVLVIGNESKGISYEVMRSVTHPVFIPNRGGTAESLNAAVAAGILMERLWNN